MSEQEIGLDFNPKRFAAALEENVWHGYHSRERDPARALGQVIVSFQTKYGHPPSIILARPSRVCNPWDHVIIRVANTSLEPTSSDESVYWAR